MDDYKIAFKYGMYGALLGFVFYLVLLFSGNSPWSNASWLGCWIPGVSAFFGIKAISNEKEPPYMSFLEVFRWSVVTVIAQALFYSLLVYLFDSMVDNNAVEIHKQEAMAAIEQTKEVVVNTLGNNMYYQMEEQIDAMTFGKLLSGDLINKIIGGIIVSLVLAGIMKKKQPIFEESE